MADHDTLVEIGALDGASGDKTFAKGFAVSSYSFGVHAAAGGNLGGGRSKGKATFADLTLTLHMSKSNAQLAEACVKQTPQPEVKLHARTGSTDPKEFTTIILKDCFITSYSAGGGGGTGQVDTISISFNSIDYKSGSIDEKGNVTQGNAFKFDLTKNA
jgi:type VI protein secretion system component Hcp